jgi:hypothetical protein
VSKTTDLPGELFVRRARAARVRKGLARPGTQEWKQAAADEQAAIEGLKKDFGVMDTGMLNWLLERKITR